MRGSPQTLQPVGRGSLGLPARVPLPPSTSASWTPVPSHPQLLSHLQPIHGSLLSQQTPNQLWPCPPRPLPTSLSPGIWTPSTLPHQPRGPAHVSSGLPGVILQGTWPSGATFHVFVCCWSASCSKLPAPEATGASQAHTTAVGGTDEQVGDRGSTQGCVRVRERASLTFATAAPGPAPRVMPGSALM